jgi:hypothetical protein
MSRSGFRIRIRKCLKSPGSGSVIYFYWSGSWFFSEKAMKSSDIFYGTMRIRTYRPHQFFWREFYILTFNSSGASFAFSLSTLLARVLHSHFQLFWREFSILSFNSSGASFAFTFSTLLAQVLHSLFQLFWREFCILFFNSSGASSAFSLTSLTGMRIGCTLKPRSRSSSSSSSSSGTSRRTTTLSVRSSSPSSYSSLYISARVDKKNDDSDWR